MSLTALALSALLGACAQPPAGDALAQVQRRGVLRVVTLNGPTTYYLGSHGHEGLDYELARELARALDVRLEMQVVANREALREALRDGRAEIAAAHLSCDLHWPGVAMPARSHQRDELVWIYRLGASRPSSVAQIDPSRSAVHGETPGDLLDALERDELQAVLIGTYPFAFIRPAHPDLRVAIPKAGERRLCWQVRADGPALRERVDAFIAAQLRNGGVAQRIADSLAAPRRILASRMREFQLHLQERLPSLQPHFEHASVRTGVDWRLLAALAYQESQWNPRAQSRQGARGIMMLMPEVVRTQRVRNVWDPRQNILAGARHLVLLRDRLPARIAEPDRTQLAIAAYNAGPGTLEDARIVTQMRGGDPDRWQDVRVSLPLLAEEKWYTRVRNGYARGWEPQYTVDRVLQFADLIAWRAAAANSTATPAPLAPPSTPSTPPSTGGSRSP